MDQTFMQKEIHRNMRVRILPAVLSLSLVGRCRSKSRMWTTRLCFFKIYSVLSFFMHNMFAQVNVYLLSPNWDIPERANVIISWRLTRLVYCNNNVAVRSHSDQHISYRFDQLQAEIKWERCRICSGKWKKHWLPRSHVGRKGSLLTDSPTPVKFVGHLSPSPVVHTPAPAHIGHSSFVAKPYSLFTWSEKQTANQLHSCHRATRRRHKLFMTPGKKRQQNESKIITRDKRKAADRLNTCGIAGSLNPPAWTAALQQPLFTFSKREIWVINSCIRYCIVLMNMNIHLQLKTSPDEGMTCSG